MNRLVCTVIFACVLLLCFFSFSPAGTASGSEFGEGNSSNLDEKRDTQETPLPRKKNFFSILGGAVYWQNLGELEHSFSGFGSGEFGSFKEWGYNFEISYHRLVTQCLGNDIQLGMDFGFFFNENDKDFEVVIPPGAPLTINLNSRGLYLTPSARMLIGKFGSARFIVGAGLGLYILDFVEQLPDGDEIFEFAQEETFGGYLSAGMGFPLLPSSDKLMLRLEAKVHFVNFGGLGGFAPGAGDLKGPIYIFQVGITF